MTATKIVFHHIAKTAGTSLIQQLKHACGKEHTASARYDYELTDELIADPELRLYHGHYSFDCVERIRRTAPGAVRVFTFLRNPLDRVVSQYYNWVDQERVTASLNALKERGGGERVTDEHLNDFQQHIFRMSLLDFLRSDHPKVRQVVYNHQTRYLSRSATAAHGMEAAAQEAIANLVGFYDFFGVTEFYGQMLLRIPGLLGLERSVFDPGIQANTNADKKKGGRYELSQEEFDLLLEHNYYDLKVYSAAVGLVVGRTVPTDAGMLDQWGTGPAVVQRRPQSTAATSDGGAVRP